MDLMTLVELVGASRVRRFGAEYRNDLRDRQRQAVATRVRSTHDGPHVQFGKSSNGGQAQVPWADFGSSHGLIIGATGSGKTWAAVSLVRQVVELPWSGMPSIGAGVLDTKEDLFARAHSACRDSKRCESPITLNVLERDPLRTAS